MRLRLGAALCLATAVAGACGGSDGDSSDGRYADQADAVCLDAQAELEQIPQPLTLPDLAPWTRRFVPVARRQVERLRKLDPPEGDEANARAFADALDRSVDAIEQMGQAARSGNDGRLQELTGAAQQATAEARALAADLGLQACATSGP
ncbi:MAG: hypothetical protein ABR583_06365 [Gaiellaceae bacterium]